uniref:MYND-type domain-containing protein n=1 Tax=Mesocestoides corti TaxID=53468 RepID=A0A5K3F7Z9_MESCO
MSITMSSRTFNAGDLIWSENAVAYALHVDASKNYCAECLTPASPQPLSRCSKCRHVFYCNRVCQKTHWPVHKRECACIVSSGAFPVATLRLLFNIITSKLYKTDPMFDSLESHVDELLGCASTNLMMEQAYGMLMVFSNKTIDISKENFYRLFGMVKVNAFHLTNECGNEIGIALFRRSSKVDHSCMPNADFAFIGKQIKIIACDRIVDQSEIRISYVDALMSTKSRQAELTSGYFFVCDCKRCRDFGQDFDSRIPPCCGKRLRGPVSDLSDNRMVAWPTDEALLASSLAKYTTVAPEEVLICDECHKAYNSAIFDAFEQRTSEIHVLKGMSNTFHVSSILPSLMKPSRWVPVVF